jgi:3-dehydrosphinganine reductase
MGLAIITGGSSGIGLAMARLLLERGMDVLAIARDAAALGAARESLGPLGRRYQACACDVTAAAALDAACARAIGRYGPPALAIACAGIARPGRFLDLPAADHAEAMATNYLGSLHLARACLPAMAAVRSGRLLLVSSAAALGTFHGFSAYTPSKAAVRALGEALALEMAPHGVSVTIAFPPDTDTPQLHAELGQRTAVARAYLAGAPVLPAEAVAKALLAATEAGRRQVAPGMGPRAMLALPVLTGWIGRWRQSRLARRLDRGPWHGGGAR